MKDKQLQGRIDYLEWRVQQLERATYNTPTSKSTASTQAAAPQSVLPAADTVATSVSGRARKPSFSERLPDWPIQRWLGLLGACITIFGFMFILSLGVRYGWFTPAARVTSLAVVSTATIFAAYRLRKETVNSERKLNSFSSPPNTPPALLSTGVAGLLLSVVAAYSLYHWIVMPVALLLTGIIAAGGYYTAHKWLTPAVLTITSISTIVTILSIFDKSSLPSSVVIIPAIFVFCVYLVNQIVLTHKQWGKTQVANTVLGAITAASPIMFGANPLYQPKYAEYDSVVKVLGHPPWWEQADFIVLIGLAMMVTVAVSAHVYGKRWEPLIPLTLMVVFSEWMQHFSSALTFAILSVAVYLLSCGFGERETRAAKQEGVIMSRNVLYAGVTALYLSVFAYHAGVEAGGYTWGSEIRMLILLSVTLLFLIGSLYASGKCPQSGIVGVVSTGFTGFQYLTVVKPQAISTHYYTASAANWWAVLISVMFAVSVVASALVLRRGDVLPKMRNSTLRVVNLITGLAATAVVFVFAGYLLGDINGFYTGHLATTLVWFGAAIMLIIGSYRWAGRLPLWILVAATGKLFLFDLVALDGALRAGLFFTVGLLILGTAYRITKKPANTTVTESKQHVEPQLVSATTNSSENTASKKKTVTPNIPHSETDRAAHSEPGSDPVKTDATPTSSSDAEEPDTVTAPATTVFSEAKANDADEASSRETSTTVDEDKENTADAEVTETADGDGNDTDDNDDNDNDVERDAASKLSAPETAGSSETSCVDDEEAGLPVDNGPPVDDEEQVTDEDNSGRGDGKIQENR